MNRVQQLREIRAEAEALAIARAAALPPGDYYASGPNVCQFIDGREIVATVCESHWAAVSVILRTRKK